MKSHQLKLIKRIQIFPRLFKKQFDKKLFYLVTADSGVGKTEWTIISQRILEKEIARTAGSVSVSYKALAENFFFSTYISSIYESLYIF